MLLNELRQFFTVNRSDVNIRHDHCEWYICKNRKSIPTVFFWLFFEMSHQFATNLLKSWTEGILYYSMLPAISQSNRMCCHECLRNSMHSDPAARFSKLSLCFWNYRCRGQHPWHWRHRPAQHTNYSKRASNNMTRMLSLVKNAFCLRTIFFTQKNILTSCSQTVLPFSFGYWKMIDYWFRSLFHFSSCLQFF